MSQHGEQTSAEVAEEAEHERADLAHTLDQLRENLQPRNVVDEVMSQAGVNSATISDRVMQIARANPVATALVGIGAAMILGAAGRKRDPRVARASGWSGQTGRTTPPRDRDPSRRVPPDQEDIAYRRAARYAANTLSSAYQPERTRMSTRSLLKNPGAGLSRLLDEQPLVLAALGVAVGAAVGSALPSTDIEAQLMGEASESLRQSASAAARQQIAQLKTTAGQTLEQMKATAAEHGATGENLSGLVHDLGDNVRSASRSIGSQAS
jgi:hypothetical protein